MYLHMCIHWGTENCSAEILQAKKNKILKFYNDQGKEESHEQALLVIEGLKSKKD